MIGLTRMGILHNLALMTAGQAPDHGEGGVREWVTVSDFKGGKVTDDSREVWVRSFQITVAGAPSGSAALWIDAATGDPLRRSQTVQFETGEMKVIEEYEAIKLDGELDPTRFEVSSQPSE